MTSEPLIHDLRFDTYLAGQYVRSPLTAQTILAFRELELEFEFESEVS